MPTDSASTATETAKPWSIQRLLGGLLLVWAATPVGFIFAATMSARFFSGRASQGPLWIFVAAILFASFLPSLWMIRRYSPSGSAILHVAAAAASTVVSIVVIVLAWLIYVMGHYHK